MKIKKMEPINGSYIWGAVFTLEDGTIIAVNHLLDVWFTVRFTDGKVETFDHQHLAPESMKKELDRLLSLWREEE